MKRTKNNQMKVNSELLSRLALASQLGLTYSGKRDLYQALGYKKDLKYDDYFLQYAREDIAKVVIDKLPKGCWSTKPFIKDGSGKTESVFEKEFDALAKKLKLYSVLNRLDKLLGLGDYAVLLLGFNDSVLFEQEVTGNPELKYIQPYSCNSAQILRYETDKTSERFGFPVLYQVQVTNPANISAKVNDVTSQSMQVHHSRIIHVVEDPLESLVFGTPRMQALFNRLQDIQKILGSNAEMFWRNASPGRVAKLDKDVTFGPGDKEDLKTQFDEYDHNLRRWLRVRGMDITELSTEVVSPKDALDAQLNIISIVTGIPKRILMGSERGELASSQDEKTWNQLLYDRMIDFCEPAILRPFIDKCLFHKILPEPTGGEYVVEWPKMSNLGDVEKAEIAIKKMDAFTKYLSAPGGTDVLPLDIFYKEILQVSEDTIKEIITKMEGLQEEDIDEEPEPGIKLQDKAKDKKKGTKI